MYKIYSKFTFKIELKVKVNVWNAYATEFYRLKRNGLIFEDFFQCHLRNIVFPLLIFASIDWYCVECFRKLCSLMFPAKMKLGGGGG